MKNKKKAFKSLNKPAAPTKNCEELTKEYNQMCAELGDAFIQFEIKKTAYVHQYNELVAQMTLQMQKEKQAFADFVPTPSAEEKSQTEEGK